MEDEYDDNDEAPLDDGSEDGSDGKKEAGEDDDDDHAENIDADGEDDDDDDGLRTARELRRVKRIATGGKAARKGITVVIPDDENADGEDLSSLNEVQDEVEGPRATKVQSRPIRGRKTPLEGMEGYVGKGTGKIEVRKDVAQAGEGVASRTALRNPNTTPARGRCLGRKTLTSTCRPRRPAATKRVDQS